LKTFKFLLKKSSLKGRDCLKFEKTKNLFFSILNKINYQKW